MLDCFKCSSADFTKNGNTDKKIGSFKEALPQLMAVSIKNLLLISYGMTLGFPTILIPAVQGGEGRYSTSDLMLHISKDEISWLSSINLICVPLGCLFSGSFTEPIGRRKAMQLVNIPIITAWLLFHFSSNIIFLYAGLCLTGLSGGLLEAPVLTYVAEITTPKVRGMLSATGSFCVILGVFIVFLLGLFFQWRTIAVYSCILPLTAFVLLFFVPESPHWLIRKNRLEEAKRNLAWLRGWVPVKKVEKEFDDICALLIVEPTEGEAAKKGLCMDASHYARRSFLLPFFIISLCFFVGHFSGMTTLQTFAVQIFNTLKAPVDKYYATMLLGVVELAGTLVYVVLVHYTGKRPLVLFSTIGCGICFLSTAIYAYFIDSISGISVDNIVANASRIHLNNPTLLYSLNRSSLQLEESLEESGFVYVNSSEYAPDPTAVPGAFIIPLPGDDANYLVWIPLVFMLGSAFISHCGIRLIPWMLIGEIYPAAVRSNASGISGGTGYIFGFLANKLFLNMLDLMTLPGLFSFYAMVSFIGFFILFFIMQETENRTLADIELHYTGKRSLNAKTDEDDAERKNSNYPANHDVVRTVSSLEEKTEYQPPKPEAVKFDVKNWESNKKFEKHLQHCIDSHKIPAEVQNAVGLGVENKSGVRPTRKSVTAINRTAEAVGRTKKHSLNLGLLMGANNDKNNDSIDTKL